jgi:hypothetical protein
MAVINYTATDKALNKFGKEVVRKAAFNLTNQKRYVSGKLWKSLDYKAITSNRSISLKFVMEDYGIILDEGRGKSQGGGSGDLYPKILEWVKKKGLRPRDSNGKFKAWKNKAKQQEGIAFAVTRKIHRFGYEPTNFFSDAFKLSFKKLPRTLKKTFALDVERFLAQTIDEINRK